MIPFFNFFIFQELGSEGIEAENVLWQKKNPCGKCSMVEMSRGGKSCSQECLWVGKLLVAKHVPVQKIPRSRKYLKEGNIWRSKKLQLVSKISPRLQFIFH